MQRFVVVFLQLKKNNVNPKGKASYPKQFRFLPVST